MSEVQELVKNVQQQSEHILSLCNSILTGHRISKPVAVVKPINNDFLRINAESSQHMPLLCKANAPQEIDADCTQHESSLHVDSPHFDDNFDRINADISQHMPLLCHGKALSEIVADNDQHMPL